MCDIFVVCGSPLPPPHRRHRSASSSQACARGCASGARVRRRAADADDAPSDSARSTRDAPADSARPDAANTTIVIIITVTIIIMPMLGVSSHRERRLET